MNQTRSITIAPLTSVPLESGAPLRMVQTTQNSTTSTRYQLVCVKYRREKKEAASKGFCGLESWIARYIQHTYLPPK